MGGFADLEVMSGLGGEVDAGAERGIEIIAIKFPVNPPSLSILYLGCYYCTYFL